MPPFWQPAGFAHARSRSCTEKNFQSCFFFLFIIRFFFAGAILNSSILPASAVHPSSETEEIKGRLEVHLKMNEDHEDHNVMTMGLFIKACVHKTCIFKRKVFDETPIPGKRIVLKRL